MLKKLLKLSLLLSLVHQTSQAYEIRISKTIMLKQPKTKVDSEFKRDASKEVVLDTKRNKMWQDNKAVTTTNKNWQDAKQHCKNLYYAGYSDWYLPSIKELETLAQSDNEPRAIVKVFRYTKQRTFWSSSTAVFDTNSAWRVDFEYGGSNYYRKSYKDYVRCVRTRQ